MKMWSEYTPREQTVAHRLFEAMQVRDALMEGPVSSAVMPLGLEELYAYATGGLAADAIGRVDQALRHRPRRLRDLDRLLDRIAPFRLPQAAAAAGGEMDRREGPGVEIRWKGSSGDPGQTYLLLRLLDMEQPAPRALIVRQGESGIVREELPEAVDRVIQLVVASDGPLMVALRDWSTRIYLA